MKIERKTIKRCLFILFLREKRRRRRERDREETGINFFLRIDRLNILYF